jgi:hypothetical protein
MTSWHADTSGGWAYVSLSEISNVAKPKFNKYAIYATQ